MNKRLLGFNVAVAKENFETAVEHWSNVFGIKPDYMKPGDFAVPGIMGAKLEMGDSLIYILAGENEKVPVAQFVANKGEGVFLVSFEVENVEDAMKDASGKGAKFVSDKPMPFPGGTVNFVHPKSMNGVQIEFVKYEKE